MSSSRLRKRNDEGFTLVELAVAFGLLLVVLVASLPAFLGMLRTAVSTKVQTQAKNLSQQRLEQLKDLRFHIDRQNGPFLDLLDIYYTNANTSGTPITVNVDGSAQTGVYVPSAAAADGAPAGPHYRVTLSRTLAGKNFTQAVYTRFLGANGAPLSMTALQNVYDSQVVGRDSAPSGNVDVTVVTSWLDGTKTKRLVSTTRIVEGRPEAPLIQTQARATAVQISSTDATGATLQLEAGLASADGSQSSGSRVSGFATGAQASRTGFPTVVGRSVAFDLPTSSVVDSAVTDPRAGGTGCSWFGFAATNVTNGTASLTGGLPKTPSTVDSTSPPTAMSGFLGANGGGSCQLLSYDNVVGGGAPLSAASPLTVIGSQMGPAPFVRVPDNVNGSGPVISGSAYVTSNNLTSSPQKSSAGARATSTQPVVIFPNNPESGGRGLVSLRLLSSSVSCDSPTTSGGAGVTRAAYTFELGWWGKGPTEPGTTPPAWHATTWSYDSATNAAPVRLSGPAWDPENTFVANGTLRLSQLITSPAGGAEPARLTTAGTSGLQGFHDGIFSLTTASTLINESQPGFSSIKVVVGKLTCVAADER